MSNLNERQHLRLYFMRHGETTGGSEETLYGHTDVELSSRGIEQSHRLNQALISAPLVAVYSSDLRRAQYAADLIARTHRVPLITLSALREIHMGQWEGQSLAAINAEVPEQVAQLFLRPESFRYPGGESFSEFERRVQNALRMIVMTHRQGAVAIVTHAGVCRLIIGHILEIPPQNWFRLAQDAGG